MQAIIIGFMGSGKTTVTEVLANLMKTHFHDLDSMIVERIGESIKDYFNDHDEQSFRDIERETLKDAIKMPGLLATGGGTPIQNASMFKTINVPVFLLDSNDETTISRLSDDNDRPLVHKLGMNGIINLKHQRQKLYEDLSDYVISTNGKKTELVAKEIIEKLRR